MEFKFGERPNKQKNWKGGPPYFPFEGRPIRGTSAPVPEKLDAPPGAIAIRKTKGMSTVSDLKKGFLVRHKGNGELGIFLKHLSKDSYMISEENGEIEIGDCIVYWQRRNIKAQSWASSLEKIS